MGSRKLHICPKVTKMGSIIGHRLDYNGVGALRGQRHIHPAKINPSIFRALNPERVYTKPELGHGPAYGLPYAWPTLNFVMLPKHEKCIISAKGNKEKVDTYGIYQK